MEIEIDYKGKKEMVVLKTLSWGENNDCVRQGVQTSPDGVRVVDFVLQQEHRLVKSIESAPFDISIEELRKLPANVGDTLFNKMMELNKLDSDVAKNSSPPLEVEEVSVEK